MSILCSEWSRAACCVFLSSSLGLAQVPLQLGAGGGILIPRGDYAGTTQGFYRGTNYGLSPGLGFHVKTRFGLAGLLIAAQMEYFIVNNSGEAEPERGRVDISRRMFGIKAGPEYFVEFSASATGYLNVNMAINNLGGDVSFQDVPDVSNTSYITNSAARFGFGMGVGVLLKLNAAATLDVGIAYNFVNPFTQRWTEEGTGTRDDSYRSLNDAADPKYDPFSSEHFIRNSRSIQTILLTCTVMFALERHDSIRDLRNPISW